jgi:hypothetical protein
VRASSAFETETPPTPPPPSSHFTIRVIMYYAILITTYFLRGFISVVYYPIPFICVYLWYTWGNKRSDDFPHLEMSFNWLKTATYVSVTNWFIVRQTLLEDVEKAIQLSMSGYDILLYKLSPFEIHVYFNNMGYYNHFIYRVYVTKHNIWSNKYVIIADMMEGYDFRKFFYSFCDHLGKMRYQLEAKKRLDLGAESLFILPSLIHLSDNAMDEVIRNALDHIKNHNISIGLRLLANAIEDTNYHYLVHRYKVVNVLENIIFGDEYYNHDKLVAITAMRLLEENGGLLFHSNNKYCELTRPLYEFKSGPFENCPYFHGTLAVNRAKELVRSSGLPGCYLIFSPDSDFNVAYLVYFIKDVTIDKITHNNAKFYIKKKAYKSVDDYIAVALKTAKPLIRPVMPLLIAYEALRIIKPKM